MTTKDAPAKDAPKDTPTAERGADIIGRTVELMKTQGLGWSKAMETARQEAAGDGGKEEIVDWLE